MKSEQVFALEHAAWPALLVHSSSTICRANAAALQAFTPALGGASPLLSAIWSRENGQTAEQFLAGWERAPRPMLVLKFHGKNGSTVAYETSVCAFTRDEEKLFLLQLLMMKEVTPPGPRTEGEQTSMFQKQKLDCALQLTRTVALDFNNALTGILGHTSFVLGQMEPDNCWRGSLLEVEKAAARAAEIASDLATFSQPEKQANGQAAANLNQLVQRTVELFRQSLGAQALEWKLLLERKLFLAKFDEAKLQQVFVKLMENSVDALGGAGRVTIQTRNVELREPAKDRTARLAAGCYVCAEVSDNGSGIAAEVLPRIFEPFFTTKGKEHRGLGLAWVYGVVTNHGGAVAISSQPNVGTSVRIYLPAEKLVAQEETPDVGSLGGTQTILVVDDEDLMLTMGQTVLSAFGYRVLTANSGQAALEILSRKEPIDLVITDLVMPTMSGRELVEHIHRLDPGMRILCTSGYAHTGSVGTADDFLQKPFTSQDLLQKVRQVLQS